MGVQFAGNILVQSNGGPLPIVHGGTGQTSATSAFNALAPSQSGNSGKVLTTDGSNASWGNISGTPGGSDTNIQYNDSGNFGGSAFLVVNKSTGAVTSTSTLTNQGLLVSKAVSDRDITYQTTGSDRWILRANSTSESGANAGSNFQLIRVADNGSTQNTVYTVNRATGVVDFTSNPTVSGSPIGAGTVTSVDVSGGTTGFTTTGGPVTTSGTVTLTGTVNETHGGTNQTAYTTGDILYASASSTLSKRAIGSTGDVLTVTGGIPVWAAPAASTASTLANATTLGTTINTALSITGIAGNTTGSAASMTIIPGGNSSVGNNLTLSAGSSTNTSAGGIVTVNGGDSGGSAGGGGGATFRGGDSSNFGVSNASVTLRGGDASGNSSNASAITVRGGNSTHGSNAGNGGSLTIAGGTSAAVGTGGSVIIQTGNSALSTRMTIANTGIITTATGTSVDFGARYTELNTAVSNSGANLVLDCSLGNNFTATIGANVTNLTFSNIPASGRVYSMSIYIAPSGAFTITWPAAVKWSAGTAPTQTATNGKVDIITLVTKDAGTTWYGFTAGLNF